MNKRMGKLARSLASVISLTVLATGLVACTASQTPSNPTTIKVVASTSVWGSIAEAIGGDKVQVTSLVHNPNQDPHSFEASVRDQAAVNNADLVLLTGNGYDSFMTPLLKASGQPEANILELAPNDTTVTPAFSHKVIDPHVWYDFAIVTRVADSITAKMVALKPANKTELDARNEKFKTAVSGLEARLDKAAHNRICHTRLSAGAACNQMAYTSIIQPESVGLRLIARFAVDITPKSVRQAVMNDSDISVADMALMKTYFFGERTSSGLHFAANTPVNWLVLNSQQTNAQTKLLEKWANQTHSTPVLSFSENLPAGDTYLSWMSANVAQIEKYIR